MLEHSIWQVSCQKHPQVTCQRGTLKQKNKKNQKEQLDQNIDEFGIQYWFPKIDGTVWSPKIDGLTFPKLASQRNVGTLKSLEWYLGKLVVKILQLIASMYGRFTYVYLHLP